MVDANGTICCGGLDWLVTKECMLCNEEGVRVVFMVY